MTLEWRQHEAEANCWVTSCGRYSVSYDHLVETWRAWKMAPGGPWFAPFGREPMSTAEDAKAICEGDTQ
jgi:hypothetical protein